MTGIGASRTNAAKAIALAPETIQQTRRTSCACGPSARISSAVTSAAIGGMVASRPAPCAPYPRWRGVGHHQALDGHPEHGADGDGRRRDHDQAVGRERADGGPDQRLPLGVRVAGAGGPARRR